LRAVHDTAGAVKDVTDCSGKLAQVEKLLKDPIYDRFRHLEEKNRTLSEMHELLGNTKMLLVQQSEEISELEPPDLGEELEFDPLLLRARDVIEGMLRDVEKKSVDAADIVESATEAFREEIAKWSPKFEEESKKYHNHIQTAGGDRKALEKQRVRLVQQRASHLARQKRHVEKRKELRRIGEERTDKIQELGVRWKCCTT